MMLSDHKLRQAQDRAYCVSEYRAWLKKKDRSISLQRLIKRLNSRCHNLESVSKRSILRWHSRAGTPLNVVRLIDRRSGRSAKTYAWWHDYSIKPGGAHQKLLHAIKRTRKRKIADALTRLAAVWAFQAFDDCPDQSKVAFNVMLFCLRCEFPGFRFSRRSIYRWTDCLENHGVDSLIDRRGGRRVTLADQFAA